MGPMAAAVPSPVEVEALNHAFLIFCGGPDTPRKFSANAFGNAPALYAALDAKPVKIWRPPKAAPHLSRVFSPPPSLSSRHSQSRPASQYRRSLGPCVPQEPL